MDTTYFTYSRSNVTADSIELTTHEMGNVTIMSVVEAAVTNSSFTKHLVDSVLLAVSLSGTLGNGLAMFILTSSAKIRKSKPFLLLMNQCLADLLNSLFMVMYLIAKYSVHWTGMSGVGGWLLCNVVFNQLPCVITSCASSYNLVILSLERMASVLWPLIHLVRCTRRVMTWAVVIIWTLAGAVIVSYALPANGVTPSGGCYYWNRFSSFLRAQIHSISFNGVFSLLPLTVMLSSYTAIYFSLALRGVATSVKLNVVRMLAVCVALFFVCHILRASLSIASRVTDRNWFREPVFMVAIVLVQVNAVVNPVVFALQYRDYSVELRRQFYRLTGCRRGDGDLALSSLASGSYSSRDTVRSNVKNATDEEGK